jgi:hypothetical protein
MAFMGKLACCILNSSWMTERFPEGVKVLWTFKRRNAKRWVEIPKKSCGLRRNAKRWVEIPEGVKVLWTFKRRNAKRRAEIPEGVNVRWTFKRSELRIKRNPALRGQPAKRLEASLVDQKNNHSSEGTQK